LKGENIFFHVGQLGKTAASDGPLEIFWSIFCQILRHQSSSESCTSIHHKVEHSGHASLLFFLFLFVSLWRATSPRQEKRKKRKEKKKEKKARFSLSSPRKWSNGSLQVSNTSQERNE
jgi:hypothetical protein